MKLEPSPEYKDALSTLVLEEHTRQQAEHIAEIIAAEPEALATGLWLLKNAEQPIPQRISWSLEIAGSINPDAFAPYADLLVDWLPAFDHPAEFRNVTKLLRHAPLPDTKVVDLFELCLKWILDPKVLAATRANCMDVAFRVSKMEPGLRRENALAIREAMRHGGPAIKARGRQVLKQLDKLEKREKQA